MPRKQAKPPTADRKERSFRQDALDGKIVMLRPRSQFHWLPTAGADPNGPTCDNLSPSEPGDTLFERARRGTLVPTRRGRRACEGRWCGRL